MLLNGGASIVQQVISLLCGLIVPQLIIGTYGSAVNGTISSITQFISIASLFQGGIAGASRVAFYKPVANEDYEGISKVYQVSKSFFRKFSLILIFYVIGLSLIYPAMVDTPFDYLDALLLVVIIGLSAIFEYLFGAVNMLLLFASQKAYINIILQGMCTLVSSITAIVLIRNGQSILVVKAVSACILLCRPLLLSVITNRIYPINKKIAPDKYELKQSGAALSKSIAFYVHTSTDTIVITSFLNVSWVSVYAVHKYVVGSISSFIASVLSNTEALFGQILSLDDREAVNKEIPVYDLLSKMISAIFFFTTITLLNTFVSIYTKGVTDINYNQPVFAFLYIAGEMFYCMSLTYNNLIMAAGHIKQTQWISISEAAINIALSVLLVWNFGIIGVAIGTLIAFVFNSVANVVYVYRHISKMSISFIIKSYLVNIMTGCIIAFVLSKLNCFNVSSYIMFFAFAFIVFVIMTLIIIGANYLFFKEYMNVVLNALKTKLIKR